MQSHSFLNSYNMDITTVQRQPIKCYVIRQALCSSPSNLINEEIIMCNKYYSKVRKDIAYSMR